MSKKVAVIAFNPVNGLGLFQYLEAFFENGISYKTFAIAETPQIKTNSGVTLILDDVIANLKGHEDEFDALVFSCGDAMLKFGEEAGKPYIKDMLAVMKAFGDKNKIIAGHCAGAVLFDMAGIANGKKVAVHPFGKDSLKNAIPVEDKVSIDGNLFTAQREDYVWMFMKKLINALKD